MASALQIGTRDGVQSETERILPYYSISDLAERWRCSRGTVYNIIRGEKVLALLQALGHRGKKLAPQEVVQGRIEQKRMRCFR